jgi:hypothetical protein
MVTEMEERRREYGRTPDGRAAVIVEERKPQARIHYQDQNGRPQMLIPSNVDTVEAFHDMVNHIFAVGCIVSDYAPGKVQAIPTSRITALYFD